MYGVRGSLWLSFLKSKTIPVAVSSGKLKVFYISSSLTQSHKSVNMVFIVTCLGHVCAELLSMQLACLLLRLNYTAKTT